MRRCAASHLRTTTASASASPFDEKKDFRTSSSSVRNLLKPVPGGSTKTRSTKGSQLSALSTTIGGAEGEGGCGPSDRRQGEIPPRPSQTEAAPGPPLKTKAMGRASANRHRSAHRRRKPRPRAARRSCRRASASRRRARRTRIFSPRIVIVCVVATSAGNPFAASTCSSTLLLRRGGGAARLDGGRCDERGDDASAMQSLEIIIADLSRRRAR